MRVRVRVRVRARARARVRVRWRAHLLGADALRNHPPALLGLRLLCLLPRARGPLVRVRFRFRFRFRFRVRVRVRVRVRLRVEAVGGERTWSFNTSASSSALYACRRVTSTLIVACLG